MEKKKRLFNTKVIHSGHKEDKETGAVMPPIHLSSTFKQKSPGNFKYEYARTNNPTREILEKLLAEIEEGNHAFAFSSGMAAINCLTDALDKNFHIICSDDVYGGTRRIFDKVKSVNQNIEITYTDFNKENNWPGLITNNTKMIWIETPSNPLLKIVDINKIRSETSNENIKIVCDNTFASPYNQQPLTLGADIVLHSSTKYLGGHSDLIGGAIVIKDDFQLTEKIKYLQNAVGSVPSPFDCYLLIRSIKTLGVRMERHNSNAILISEFLKNHPKIKTVRYPGLKSDPNHELATSQMNGYGGIISIELDTDLNGTIKFLENIEIFTLAESLGGVESLIEHPAIMTHASIDKNIRDELGISDSLVRLSIGIEDPEDLKNALENSLNLL
ncbi:PLP-dependent aspartate aminotransferase family protein [Pelagibacteraceae bacterium]|nr:PLP-dependent aspartate aminotransferase family protein [Pelagibacteraceae bacterium]